VVVRPPSTSMGFPLAGVLVGAVDTGVELWARPPTRGQVTADAPGLGA
jgi:hypothetical protein